MTDELLSLVAAREGHFRLESGHHTNRWLDLEGLFVEPARLRPFVDRLAHELQGYELDAVCGPLAGGAFLAQMLAPTLGAEFFFTERVIPPQPSGMYGARYLLPGSSHGRVSGKRFAIVDDAISAGSAVRGTYTELQTHKAQPVVVGALLVLGSESVPFFAGQGVPVESVFQLPFELWLPEQCPLCASHMAIEDPASSRP